MNSRDDLYIRVVGILSTELDLKNLMQAHAISSIFIGVGCILIPHSWLTQNANYNKNYDHFAHEFLRLYGALTLGIGWLVWKTSDITDGRLKRTISESFALCYIVQSLSMIRAHIGDPEGHNAIHLLAALTFAGVGALYGYLRFVKKIKTFELPGLHDS